MDKKTLLDKYHTDTLTKEEEQYLEELIASDQLDLSELDDFQEIMSDTKLVEVSKEKDHAILKMISSEKLVNKKGRISWVAWLAGLSFVALTFVLVLNFDQESANTIPEKIEQDFASSLLSSENSTDKIQLVSNTNIDSETDKKVIDALLYSLNSDESSNVRIACINALANYAYMPEVRAGLISSISNQKSGVVLSNIADAINTSGETLSKEEFYDRINKNLPEPIKATIESNFIKI